MFDSSTRPASIFRGSRGARWLAKKPLLIAGAVCATGAISGAIVTSLLLVDQLHDPVAVHGDQAVLLALVNGGQNGAAFNLAFGTGDALFDAKFNALDGGGANVGKGQRFTRVPRADLAGAGEWANHSPSRATGPNAQNCGGCHNLPFNDGAGGAETNAIRDPLHSGLLSKFISRNTPHVFGMGGVQRLAEEMTTTLLAQRDVAIAQVCGTGGSVTVQLNAKGVSFGSLVVTRTTAIPCRTSVNTAGLVGVSTDLVVRPFQWKGSVAFIRDFTRGASHNELGMESVEIIGSVDGDADGVNNEMTIGDQTSLAIYMAAQQRPTTKVELSDLGLLVPALTGLEIAAISRGSERFAEFGCAACHVPSLTVENPIFTEPSQNAKHRDTTFPAGQNPVAVGVDPAHPVSFDITADQPDNRILDGNGNLVFHLGAFKKNANGAAIVECYGDLKRHGMGTGLFESIDETGTGAGTFMTENLWGVGSTAPYMHDGRSTTLTEAILEHGGEAQAAKNNFRNAPLNKQQDLIAFLDNLVLFVLPE